MGKERVLLIDDDINIQEIIKLYMEKEGFSLEVATDGYSALHVTEKFKPDIIILDVMLPGMDGFEVCRLLRQRTDVPILFLSAKEDDFDQVLGHRIGGDDYITKPFSPRLLVAKVMAHLRRSSQMDGSKYGNNQTVLQFPNLTIEKENCIVTVNGKPVALSAKEFLLLCLLAENPNRVFSVEHIFDSIWGEDSLGDYRTVMVHISNLRKKIELDPAKPIYILTVRGMGYKFSMIGE
ncbi:response regulator transcription factor [Metabacillus fastidiosus]|uniref:response regulator transcription factor n=1 Tax=Metabacillus fastidiosus TaxID=1458 RepID=UPI002E1B26C0|nr:response regulator transcription factor [Metabacillus fastidiosus]